MVCANSIVNPFVYAIKYHEFQQRIKELFKRKLAQEDDIASVSTVLTSLQRNDNRQKLK